MKTQITIAAAAVILLKLLAPYAIAAERNITGELTVLPYSLAADRNATKEFLKPAYVVSREQQSKEELAVMTSFALIDYSQSVAAFFGSGQYSEMNPLLGSKPSKGDMIAFGVAGVGLFYILANTLSDPWRQIVIDSIIASEQLNIEDNRRAYEGWNTGGPPIRGRSINGIPIVISLRF